MNDWRNLINSKLLSFNRKYYKSLFLKGFIFSLSLVLGYLIVASLAEHNLWLSSAARLTLLILFIGLLAFCLYYFLGKPLQWWLLKRGLRQEETAKLIGKSLPQVSDRLLNVIQLSNLKHSALAEAGIIQKSKQLEPISFESVIKLADNKRFLKYLAVPAGVILLVFILNQQIITGSVDRIINFNQEFSPQAPFSFHINNETLKAFVGEDFTLRLNLSGDAFPEAVYISSGSQQYKMTPVGNAEFVYTFEKVQKTVDFQFYASGFYSEAYQILLLHRPEVSLFQVHIDFPRYLNKLPEEIVNNGNLEVPEGSRIEWTIGTTHAQKGMIGFNSDGLEKAMQSTDNQIFNYSRGFSDPDQYWITLENEDSRNKDKINYSIHVIKDEFPQLRVNQLRDSILYKTIYFGGRITDDYGLTALELRYQISGTENHSTPQKRIKLPLLQAQADQEFYYRWPLDSLELSPGDELTYFLQVWDNDGVNGRKSTRSSPYVFTVPGFDELKKEIARSENATDSKVNEGLDKAKSLKESIEDAQNRLKGKHQLDWQDKALLEDILKQKQDMEKLLQELQEQNRLLDQKKEAFTEQDQRLKEKAKQIQKLMDELLDDETRKLFEELEKLLRDNSNMEQMQKMLDQIQRREMNLEKELDRLQELLKMLKYEDHLDRTINELKENLEKQEGLLEKTEEESKKGKSSNEEKSNELAKEQEQIKEQVDDLEKSLEELNQLKEDAKEPGDLPTQEEMQEMEELMEKSEKQLKEGQPKNSIPSQKKAIQKMKEMAQQMEGMMSSSMREMNMENIESLKQILHGLIKLSYDQEKTMQEFNQVLATDPRYIQLSQNQLKVQDDAKVLEDSLLALGKRDPFMGAFITREVSDLNAHLDKAIESIRERERRKGSASAEMQLSMTSINNLALMLNDHFEMMMEMMANAMKLPSKKKGKGNPSLSEMQQKLNQQIEQIKGSGKGGRELSEELARMAAEQERIRQALQELQQKMKDNNGKVPGNDIPGKMEQTEIDLVNKQITEQTIKRQKEILTRLLDAEKSMREQDLDQERKGETAKDYEKEIPKAFQEYLMLKEKEVELLKTVPPKLFPYYKKEVNEYFKRIGNQN